MKRFLLLSVLICTLASCSSPSRHFDNFIDDHKEQKRSIAMTIPGWIIRSGTNWASRFAENEDEKAYLSIGQHIKRIRFLVIDEGSNISGATIKDLLTEVKKDGIYEEYLSVRNPDANVNVLVHEEKDIIKGLVILANGDDSFALVNLKTELPLHIFENTDFSFLKEKNTNKTEN